VDDRSVNYIKTPKVEITTEPVDISDATTKKYVDDLIANLQNQITATSATYSIGDVVNGGVVFWLDSTGQHGLIAATADQSAGIRWYGGSYTYTRARADGIGAGIKNTAIIIANQGPVDGSAFAATVCNEYSVTVDGVTYGDWYLPSKHELDLLYIERDTVGGFTTNYYWSSTEGDNDLAWNQFFSNGNQYNVFKNITYYSVRAVRAF
jgi:hypothetical protein